MKKKDNCGSDKKIIDIDEIRNQKYELYCSSKSSSNIDIGDELEQILKELIFEEMNREV